MKRCLVGGLVLFAALAGGCVVWPEGTGPSAAPMPLDEALARRDRGEAVIIDVRSARFFSEGHIPGAISIPAAEIPSRIAEIRRLGKLPILYCG
jgi:rhodanese-related sulfurtransferase